MSKRKKIIDFIKSETVLCVACILAVISVCIVPPDKKYAGYIDYRVIALLFCLMTIMQGFISTGLFAKFARMLLDKVKTFRQLMVALVMLCFVCSMWITNDVSLITFIPFTILVLKMAGLEKEMIPVIVLQTIAGNLGSMATPVGNPQNLYLYSSSGMGISEFLKTMVPLSVVSLIMILAVCLLHKNYPVNISKVSDKNIQTNAKTDDPINKKINTGTDTDTESGIKNILLALMFIFSLLSVLRIISWQLLLVIVIAGCVVISVRWKERFLPLKVDFGLLLTFAAFFIFTGNMARVGYISSLINKLMYGRELIVSFLCSQVISNVPAAILLSGFTDNYAKLLMGVNIGGLGTLIASLASLISYKFFVRECQKEKGKYMIYFTVLNVVMALTLLAIADFIL